MADTPIASLGIACDARSAVRAAPLPITVSPAEDLRARAIERAAVTHELRALTKVSQRVKARLAEAQRAYNATVIDALRELRIGDDDPSIADIREAMDVSRATAYRYLQRLRGAESADA